MFTHTQTCREIWTNPHTEKKQRELNRQSERDWTQKKEKNELTSRGISGGEGGKKIEKGKNRRWEEGKEKLRSNNVLTGKVVDKFSWKRFVISLDSRDGDWSWIYDPFFLFSQCCPKAKVHVGLLLGEEQEGLMLAALSLMNRHTFITTVVNSLHSAPPLRGSGVWNFLDHP